jgi:hypothetical protein
MPQPPGIQNLRERSGPDALRYPRCLGARCGNVLTAQLPAADEFVDDTAGTEPDQVARGFADVIATWGGVGIVVINQDSRRAPKSRRGSVGRRPEHYLNKL